MKRNVLFVTDAHGNPDEGLSYALELAKMVDKGISVLMVQPKKLSERFEDVMTAITFAEAGEHKTAIGIMNADGENESPMKAEVEEACRRSGITPVVKVSEKETESAIYDYLKHNGSVDMVVLSPNLTMNGGFSSRSLKRLVRTVTAPIVTLTKTAQTALPSHQ